MGASWTAQARSGAAAMVLDPLTSSLHAAGKRVASCAVIGTRLVVTAVSVVRSAACPSCGRCSRKRHGRYWRRLAECPCFGAPVTLEVELRRFQCRNRCCPRRTFAEPIGPLAAVRQRCTVRMAAARRAVGLALGGQAGARLAARLGMPTSGPTLLRTLRRSAQATSMVCAPIHIGIDDWALTRGHRYGTIVVDLDRHRPIELLAGRDVATIGAWLAEQRDIRLIARDRAGAYADAATRATPSAVQVADRWHLLGNLRDALERLLARHTVRLREAAHVQARASQPQAVAPEAAPSAEPISPNAIRRHPAAERRVQANRARRLVRYEQVVQLRSVGLPIRRIAVAVGLDRRTVRGFIRVGAYPERAPREAVPTQLDAYRAHLAARVAQGCTNAALLWRELAAQGFEGRYRSVQRAVALLRPASTELDRSVASGAALTAKPLPPPSPRRACAWVLGWKVRNSAEHDAEVRHRFVERLCTIEPTIGVARAFMLRFIAIVRAHDVDAFERWLAQARGCAVAELRRFAAGVAADLDAVRAAIGTPWSSGQVEGQINRLKYLKRQMYGHAKLDLLRIRVLNPN